MAKDTVEVLIEGGTATPGPPLGPALGPLGINMMQVVEEINKKSADFAGMKVPVIISVDRDTKDFEIEIGTPPTTALIMEELGIEKASHEPGLDIVNDLPIETALKITRMKFDSLLANDYKAGIKEVIYLSDKYATKDAFIASKKLLDSCGVKYRQIELSGNEVKLEL